MGITWKQKKETLSQLMGDYKLSLKQEGFVSYQEEGFSWYKVDNGLLYTVHMMPLSPSMCNIWMTFAVFPLFSWEYIAYKCARRDWSSDFVSAEHGILVRGLLGMALAEAILSRLPRPYKDYMRNTVLYHHEGVLVGHWNTEKNGAEILDEIVFPILRKIDSIQKVYDLHKTCKLIQIPNNADDNPIVSFMPEEEYLRNGNKSSSLTMTFAEECLYFNDKKWFPMVKRELQSLPGVTAVDPQWWIGLSKMDKEEVTACADHAKKLIRYIETDDRNILEGELEKNKEKMLKQIKKKLPDLCLGSLELRQNPTDVLIRKDPFRLM